MEHKEESLIERRRRLARERQRRRRQCQSKVSETLDRIPSADNASQQISIQNYPVNFVVVKMEDDEESPIERRRRLGRERQRRRRQCQSQEILDRIRSADNARHQISIRNETPEQLLIRRARKAAEHRRRRERETPEQLIIRKARKAAEHIKRRERQTPDQSIITTARKNNKIGAHLESSNEDKVSIMSENHDTNSNEKNGTPSKEVPLKTDLNSQQKSSFKKSDDIPSNTEKKSKTAKTANIENSDDSLTKPNQQDDTKPGMDCIQKKESKDDDIDSSQLKPADNELKSCESACVKMELDFEVESNGSEDLNVSSSGDVHLKLNKKDCKTENKDVSQIRDTTNPSDNAFMVPSKDSSELKDDDDEMDVDVSLPNDTPKSKAPSEKDETSKVGKKKGQVIDLKINDDQSVGLPSQKDKCDTDAEMPAESQQTKKDLLENKVADKGKVHDVDSPSKEPGDVAQDVEDNTKSVENSSKDKEENSDNKVNQKDKSRGIDAIAKKLGLQMKVNENNAESQSDNNSTESSENKKSKENLITSDVESSSKPNENESTEPGAKTEVKEKEKETRTPTQSKTEQPKQETERTKSKKGSRTCVECGVTKGLKFQVLYQGKTRYLCSDTCFKSFKSKQKLAKSAANGTPAAPKPPPQLDICAFCKKEMTDSVGFYPLVGETKPLCSQDCLGSYHDANGPKKKCSQCKNVIDGGHNCLTWETMEFCNEDCLGKYQSFLGSHCTCCQSPVHQTSLGKYCVCFGADIRQFCSGSCLEEFKKGLKVCSFCQKDLSSGVDGFLAPVGDKGQFKDFCTQQCMERYESMNSKTLVPPQPQPCFICKTTGVFKIQVKHEEKTTGLCSDNCVAGFRYVNKINSKMCDTCYQFFEPEANSEFFLQFEGAHKYYCTKACMTLFVLSHRKIVPCTWCKVKKYNFDMIEKVDTSNQVQMYCSLNCLSLYRVSLNATSSRSIRCDNCTKNLPAQYHLTMSDGSIRNFCSYQCVIQFQNQFTNVPTLTTVTPSNRQNATQQQPTVTKSATASNTPVISNVMSLATSAPRSATPTFATKLVPQKLVAVRQQPPPLAVITTKTQTSSSTVTTSTPTSTIAGGSSGSQIVREVIVKPPAPKSVKNKTVLCKPIMQTKGVSCKPHPCHKAVQTEESPRPMIVPIPVPVYVPIPVHMFSRPVPCPVPFPVPIPVPIFVPTTKDSPTQIIKHLKDIQEKIPSNPFEAELLMMAEMVAEDGEKKDDAGQTVDEVSSVSNVDETASIPHREQVMTPEAPLDVETAMPPGITPVVQKDPFYDQDALSDQEDEFYVKDGRSHGRGKRSAMSRGRGRGRKRPRLDELSAEDSDSLATIPVVDDQISSHHPELPDSNARLKVTLS